MAVSVSTESWHPPSNRRVSSLPLRSLHQFIRAVVFSVPMASAGDKTQLDKGDNKQDILSVTSDKTDKDVVVITGGNGFLGQQIVKVIQERADDVREIRVFDRVPYQNKLGHLERIPVTSVVGDIKNLSHIRAACKGANSVLHTAALVSFGTFPDFQGMEEVNVKGTANVIQACVENAVERLVYTSTIDVVVGYDDILGGDETLPVPRKLLFPGYPATKLKAEKLVLESNGRRHSLGGESCIRTLALRPNVMYGEGDPYYVTNGLRSARDQGGELVRVGDGRSLFQQAYVGNMAWAHLSALQALKQQEKATKEDSLLKLEATGGLKTRGLGSPGLKTNNLADKGAQCCPALHVADIGGQAYFITDDTPLMNSFKFMECFLVARGYRLSSYSLPYPLVYSALWATEWLLWCLSPIRQINLATPLCSLIYINRNLFFSREKAERLLGYKPIYSWETSKQRSLEFYKSNDL